MYEDSNIHPTCIIEPDVQIGKGCLIGPWNFIRNGTVIGDKCRIGPMNVFEGKLKVGNNVRMGTHINLGWYTTIEDYVFIAGHTTGANDKRIAYCRKLYDNDFKGYTIKRAARIGLGVIFMPGVVVGEEALVGTASLVTKNVKPMEIVYGVPAVHKGWVTSREKLLTSD